MVKTNCMPNIKMVLHLDGSVTLYDECCITNYSKTEWCDIKISEDLKYTEANILPNISHNIICAEIEEGLTQITSYTFMNCIRIKEIIIPDSVESIGKYIFNNLTHVFIHLLYFLLFSLLK